MDVKLNAYSYYIRKPHSRLYYNKATVNLFQVAPISYFCLLAQIFYNVSGWAYGMFFSYTLFTQPEILFVWSSNLMSYSRAMRIYHNVWQFREIHHSTHAKVKLWLNIVQGAFFELSWRREICISQSTLRCWCCPTDKKKQNFLLLLQVCLWLLILFFSLRIVMTGVTQQLYPLT